VAAASKTAIVGANALSVDAGGLVGLTTASTASVANASRTLITGGNTIAVDGGGNVSIDAGDIASDVAAAVLSVALTEGYAAEGAQFTLSQAMYMIWSLLAERAITGATLTASRLNGTSAMTFTLDSDTAPTSQTRTT
jgi:hypothetical protein